MALLEIENLHVSYGAIVALRGISFQVQAGQVVSLIGANGAGKSTTINTLSGLIKPRKGAVRFDGHDLAGWRADRVVRQGLVQVPEGRQIIATLTVQENLEMGAYLRKDQDAVRHDIEAVFERFPRLQERRKQKAGSLSGGEQQMLAVARTLMGNPLLVLLDEPSEGVAPLIVEQMAATIVELKKEGLSILLSEQNIHFARLVSDRVYVLEKGQIRWQGSMAQLDTDLDVQRAYLTV
jgi:branched-chain amino acid transport system ATP-binding protein